MTSRSLIRLGLVGALGLGLAVAGCGGSSSKDEIVIGEYGSLTGNDATFGQSTKNGVELALQELTASKGGTIGGLPVRVVSEDDQGKAEEAATVVQKPFQILTVRWHCDWLNHDDSVGSKEGFGKSGASTAPLFVCFLAPESERAVP